MYGNDQASKNNYILNWKKTWNTVVNQDNSLKKIFELANFPDFCEDATTVVWYLNVSVLNSPPTVNICLKNYPQGNVFLEFLEFSHYQSSYPQGVYALITERGLIHQIMNRFKF